MSSSLKYTITLLWMISTIIVALLIFTGGFLLRRIEIKEYSSCDSKFDYADTLSNDRETCWMPGRFRKAVVVIIDALRYDFIQSNKSMKVELPFQNKLKYVNEILSKNPDKTALYKFVADPPTTTMQRLKGLTTGSLPTFVDAGANFAGSHIEEDNIIDQLRNQHKRIVFMGDDTWLDLFPSQFSIKYPFPSLNVKDLDTVDNGVIDNIFHEMNKTDWDLIIGHFLGVDHCGHTYGPYHPMMAQKLTQMDEVLRKIISALPDDAVLIVFGDHGMTRTGDHGGDSKDELEAGLFVYSNQQITSRGAVKENSETIAQIDLVPTFSLLLGLPIPFSNLGKVIPELFSVCKECKNQADVLFNQARASHLNSQQVRSYLHSYSKVSDEFPHQELLELEVTYHSTSEQFHQVVTDIKKRTYDDKDVIHRLINITGTFQEFLQSARIMCDKIWAQFDVLSMCIGSAYFFICFIFCWQLDDPSCFNKLILSGMMANVMVLPCLLVLILMNISINGFVLYSCALITVFPIGSYLLFKIMSSEHDRSNSRKWVDVIGQNITATVSWLSFVVYLLGYLSNSYVVYDDSVSSFMLQFIVWTMFYSISVSITKREFAKNTGKHQNSKKSSVKPFDLGRVFTSPRTLLLLLCLALCLCLRLAKHFRPCREEQWTCETSQFMQPLSAITDDFRLYKNFRYFFSATCIAIVVLGTQKWLRHCGNLNGFAPSVLLTKYLQTLNATCIAFYWAFQALPKNTLEKFQIWQQDFFAQLSYLSFIIYFLVMLVKPLSIYILPQEQEKESMPFISSGDSDLVPKVYNHLKVNWQTLLKSKDQDRTPVVYGLGTVYSAVFVMLVGCFSLLLAMLLGDGMVGGIVLQILVMFLFLEIHACCVRTEEASEERKFLVPWYSVIAWCLICSHFFYATGHQATIPAIRFESAYVGFHGNFNVYILPAILILLNTFASHTLGILALPLLLFWPCLRGRLIYYFDKESANVGTDDQRGELMLHEEQEQFHRGLFQLFMSYLVISALKSFASLLAAGIHRRHLMVWKIFAPRFVFEAAIFLFTSFMLTLVYLLVLRVNKAVSEFIKKLS